MDEDELRRRARFRLRASALRPNPCEEQNEQEKLRKNHAFESESACEKPQRGEKRGAGCRGADSRGHAGRHAETDEKFRGEKKENRPATAKMSRFAGAEAPHQSRSAETPREEDQRQENEQRKDGHFRKNQQACGIKIRGGAPPASFAGTRAGLV
ncbi:hypothetical protein [Candidatus Spyradosoma sp. SGI.093]|uniref:hypothetical protein n=1 Tax=Candidatus Spyradosoma sp. SGI.093 TaxID=3420583 RepID=UPI003D03D162